MPLPFARFWRPLLAMRFAREVLTLQTGTLLSSVVGFAASVVFARTLGIEGFGRYAVVLAFVGTAQTLFNLGQGTTLLVFFSEQFGRRDRAGMAAVLRNFLHMSALNLATISVLIAVAPRIAMQFYGDPAIGALSRVPLLFHACDIGNSMTLVLLQSVRRIRWKVVLEQSANVSSLALAIAAALAGFGVEGIFAAQLIVGVAMLLVSVLVLSHIARAEGLPGIREVLAVRAHDTAPYFGQGILIAVDKNVGNLFPQGLYFALSLVAPHAIIGLVRLAAQLAQYPKLILLGPIADLSSSVLAKQAGENLRQMRCNALRVIGHTIAIHAATTVGFAVAVIVAVPILYGEAYRTVTDITLLLLPIALLGSVNITSAALLRALRIIHYSTIEAVIAWALMLAAIFFGAELIGPIAAFVIAFGIGYVGQSLLTLCLFIRILPRRVSGMT